MALWGIPLILFLSYQGSYYFLGFVLVINSISLWEFYAMQEKRDLRPYKVEGLMGSTILILCAFWFSLDLFLICFLLILSGLLIRHLGLSLPSPTFNTAITIIGITYITLFLCSALILRNNIDGLLESSMQVHTGGRFFILLWIGIWICDTMAYFGGRLLGKHKLAPQTSPNKTVEGAFAGLLGAILAIIGLGIIFVPDLSQEQLLITALIVGLLGQLGDLIESRFKRDAGVKDTSAILPGHGGFLDRFDSFIFISPFLLLFYYLNG
jgi:phosphatidate cytidylyltransferase